MPLLITPYTFGTELPAAPGGTAGGGAYSVRRRRVMTIVALCLVLVFL
jgi:hypothetical protein